VARHADPTATEAKTRTVVSRKEATPSLRALCRAVFDPVDERSEAAAVDVGWESLGERTL
jgi:hypothetical protein